MPEAMLKNGGFEQDWGDEQSHRVKVFPHDGQPYVTEMGEFHTPPGWLSWFVHRPGVWDQPEVGDIREEHVPYRVREGEKAARLFTFYRKHDAGFMQTVAVEKGSLVRFTAWAHAWSNHPIAGHEGCTDDGRCSAGVGREAYCSPDAPEPSGDPWADAVGNFAFAVGIDPEGGEDPRAETVVWSDALHIYNAYCELSVETTARAGEVTVFLRSTTLWAFKHNDAYWDDAALEVVEPPPGPEKCVCPRAEYLRSYVLLPQLEDRNDAMLWRACAAAATSDSLETIGHSADDAGVGPDQRYVTAVNPGEWGDDLEGFFNQYYPGASYEALEPQTPWECGVMLAPPLADPVAIGQLDPRWRDWDFGEAEGGTIGEVGCFLTGLAMFFRRAGLGVEPQVLDVILRLAQVAYSGDNMAGWSRMPGLFPSFFRESLVDNARWGAASLQQLADDGWDVILAKYNYKHFVLFERADGDDVVIIDTLDGEQKTISADWIGGVRALRRKDHEPEPPPDVGETISFHVQGNTGGLRGYVERAQPATLKLCHCAGEARWVREASPDTMVVYRKVENDWKRYAYGWEASQGLWDQAAAKFVSFMMPELQELAEIVQGNRVGVEGLNETIACGAVEDIRRVVLLESAIARKLAELPFINAAYVGPNIAVGNPEHGAEMAMLVPLARVVEEVGGFFSYHGYGPVIGDRSWLEVDWKHYAGRWCEMDRVFREHGVRVDWLVTERGPIGGTAWYDASEDKWKPSLNAGAGWRHGNCLGGDWERAAEHVRRCDQMCRESVPGREGRYYGGHEFTVPGTGEWIWFAHGEEQFGSLP